MGKKTLVIGASMKPYRYSNYAIRKLLNYGHEVVAIGKEEGRVAGIRINPKPIDYKDLDTVTLYLNPDNQKDFYDYVISLKPKRVIFNPGAENPEFYGLLKENNIPFEVACTLVLLSTNQY